jgi:capsid protein
LEEECASQGLDWEEVIEQRVKEQKKLQELGLSLNENKEQPTKQAEETEEVSGNSS